MSLGFAEPASTLHVFNSYDYYSSSFLLAEYDLNSIGGNLHIECQQPRKLLSWIELDYYIEIAVKDLAAYQAVLSGPSPTYGQIYPLQASLNTDLDALNKIADKLLANPYITNQLRISFLQSTVFMGKTVQIFIKDNAVDALLSVDDIEGFQSAFSFMDTLINYQLETKVTKADLKEFATDLRIAISAIKQYQAAVLAGTSTDDLLPFQRAIDNGLASVHVETNILSSTDSVGSEFYKFVIGVRTSLEPLQFDINNGRYETVTLKTMISPGVVGDIVSNILPRDDMNILLTNLEADSAYMINVLKGDVLDNMISGCVAAIIAEL